MKLWLASTDPQFVREQFTLGLFVGVLTNPSTLASAKRPPREVIGELCQAVSAPVFYQLRDANVEAMKREASSWLDLGWANLGIKVALTREGCAILHWLKVQGVSHRLATCVPTVVQVLLADALDVPWITPTGSALEKVGGPSKLTLVAEMQQALDRQHSATRLIPSLASPAEMQALALSGVQSGFVWDRDVGRFVDHDLVRQGVAAFAPAWEQLAAFSTTEHQAKPA
jgi:transaldolase